MNRRSFLAGIVSGSVIGLSGCLSESHASGYVEMKVIEGTDASDSPPTVETVIQLWLGERSEEYSVQPMVPEKWGDRFDDPHEPTVPDSLHTDLQSEYDEVKYAIGVCSPSSWGEDDYPIGCRRAETTRGDFNRVQLRDQVTASYDDEDATLSIHDVDGKWAFDSD